jgi:hypothetical protein
MLTPPKQYQPKSPLSLSFPFSDSVALKHTHTHKYTHIHAHTHDAHKYNPSLYPNKTHKHIHNLSRSFYRKKSFLAAWFDIYALSKSTIFFAASIYFFTSSAWKTLTNFSSSNHFFRACRSRRHQIWWTKIPIIS